MIHLFIHLFIYLFKNKKVNPLCLKAEHQDSREWGGSFCPPENYILL